MLQILLLILICCILPHNSPWQIALNQWINNRHNRLFWLGHCTCYVCCCPQVISERDILGTQLVRRNDELALLYEKIKIQQSTLNKGEIQYNQRLEDIRVLKLEIRKLRREKAILQKSVANVDDLRLVHAVWIEKVFPLKSPMETFIQLNAHVYQSRTIPIFNSYNNLPMCKWFCDAVNAYTPLK